MAHELAHVVIAEDQLCSRCWGACTAGAAELWLRSQPGNVPPLSWLLGVPSCGDLLQPLWKPCRDPWAPCGSSSAVGLFPLSLQERKRAAVTRTNLEALALPVPSPACPVQSGRPKNKNSGYCVSCEQMQARKTFPVHDFLHNPI